MTEQTSGSTDGTDPIAYLCAGLRKQYAQGGSFDCALAADALERLARERSNLLNKCTSLRAERDVALDTLAEQEERAERAEAERDALRECVRAADAMRANLWMPSLAMAYNAARAKVKP